ncbi:helix-turn-helix domain-containing protein [Arthrobacter sp. H14-L1]|uniref:helix-turn-helix domain-containing protein n=1 Tax=Arthrobacter sp. H14-L1 TaxID=2996697 RepID=UPI00226D61FD|nr:helix-turn-helix domain-containing protein [Arthrobacter sp. H14-L1]MCY0905044.1 helix-turn-helix domain-containing protein [Arthrobacter sp. H14-L1]
MQTTDVEQLVEQLAAKLRRGLSLEDLDGILLAYSSGQVHADRVRVNLLLSKRVPADVSGWQLAHGISAAVRPVVVPANAELGMLGRVCVPLLVRGFRVGYLWVQQEESELTATAILAELPDVRNELDLLSSLLLDSNTAESENRRRREQDFLAACLGKPAAIAAAADREDMLLRGPWQLAVLLQVPSPPRAGSTGSDEADPLAQTLIHRTAALQASIGVDDALFSAGTDTHAVILFRSAPAGKSHAGQATVRNRYERELAKRSGSTSRTILGLSESFAAPRQLTAAYLQAKVAVQAAAVEPQLTDVLDYCATGVYQLLAAGRWEQMSSVHYRNLQAADRNAELLPVLELLYDSDGAVQDVADAVHLHRSSVYNRIARVRSLIGTDPLRGLIRLELHLALKADRWQQRPRI